MARQPEIVKIASSPLEKTNISAGKIRNYLALCVYAARDRDYGTFDNNYKRLVTCLQEFHDRVNIMLSEDE